MGGWPGHFGVPSRHLVVRTLGRESANTYIAETEVLNPEQKQAVCASVVGPYLRTSQRQKPAHRWGTHTHTRARPPPLQPPTPTTTTTTRARAHARQARICTPRRQKPARVHTTWQIQYTRNYARTHTRAHPLKSAEARSARSIRKSCVCVRAPLLFACPLAHRLIGEREIVRR